MSKTFRALVLGILILVAMLAYALIPNPNSTNNTVSENIDANTQDVLGSPSEPTDNSITTISFNDEVFSVASIKVENIENIVLGSNLSEKYTSRELFNRLNCTLLISGGFYTRENTPVGLFIEDGNLSKNFLTNDLFDGVFSINFSLTPRITRETPKDDLKYAIQSGPILVENSIVQNLSMKKDKARRVVAATTGDNEVVFIIIYDQISKLIGPDLEDLPNILDIWQKESGISLADAINLDGGSASAFVSEEIKLTESSPIGSYFCIKL